MAKREFHDSGITAENLLHFLEFNEDYEIIFEWINKQKLGDMSDGGDDGTGERTIRINLALLLLETYIHEYIHVVLPDIASEEDVEDRMERAIKRIPAKDLAKISKKLMKILLIQLKEKDSPDIHPH